MKKNESKGIWLFDPGPFGPEGSEPHRPRRVRAWIVVTVVVALVLAGLGVWQVLRVRGAVASCESMAAQATAAYEDLLKLAESGELKDAEAITADQVEDPDTVTGLAAAVDKAGETVSIGVRSRLVRPVLQSDHREAHARQRAIRIKAPGVEEGDGRGRGVA